MSQPPMTPPASPPPLRRLFPGVRPFRPGLACLATALLFAGCGSEPPAFEVAGVGFSQQDLLGISPSRLEVLGSLTRLGAATASGQLEALAAPVAERAEVEDLARAIRAEELLAQAEVDDAVLQERYRTNPSYELTVRHLVILAERYESEEARDAARGRAEAALARIEAGAAFPEVAGEVSEEPGAADRGGLLQPGREGTWVDEFWASAMALEIGEVSGVVETPFGFHVLRLDGRDTVPFPEVRSRVAAEVGALIGPLPASIDDVPLPDGLTANPDGQQDGGAVARFEGGAVGADDVSSWAATLPPDRWDAFVAGDDSAWEEALHRGARAAHVRALATAMGLEPDPAAAAAARAAWVRQAQGWGATLGFTPNLQGDALRDAALEALGRSGQLPELARQDIHRARPLLEFYSGVGP